MSDEQVLALEDSSADDGIDEWVAERTTSQHAIALPSHTDRVVQAVADGARLGELTNIVERDPTLSMNVARLACSSAYTGNAGERVSLPYAIMRLGPGGLRSVCLTTALAPIALSEGPLASLRRRVWRECIASAVTCQAAGVSRGLPADDAYLAGLLHDFGKIVALVAAESNAHHIAAGNAESFWVELMERHHCDAGWVMTDVWRLPAEIQRVTARHHEPSAGEALHEAIATVDRIVQRAIQLGWQISADEIARIEGVRSADEAMALRIGLARHPYFYSAILDNSKIA